jgi:hypothetical protein
MFAEVAQSAARRPALGTGTPMRSTTEPNPTELDTELAALKTRLRLVHDPFGHSQHGSLAGGRVMWRNSRPDCPT